MSIAALRRIRYSARNVGFKAHRPGLSSRLNLSNQTEDLPL